MPRAIARGRMVPQSLSTDPRVGQLSLKAALLFPLMWINCDDQGRISGNPAEVKYVACPNIDHIRKEDIPELLQELQTQKLILVYSTSTSNAIQMLDWWQEQRLQWAYPSRYPPPEGWQDRLRYHASPTEVVTKNWPSKSDSNSLPSKLPSALPKGLPSTLGPKEREGSEERENRNTKERIKRNRRGRGNLPSALPSALGSTSPSPTALSTDKITDKTAILKTLTQCFRIEWARVPADRLDKIIPREPTARESAQLRDIAEEISAAGGAPPDYIKQAFREAAAHQKCYISYVRRILLDWLGIGRGPPG